MRRRKKVEKGAERWSRRRTIRERRKREERRGAGG